LARLQALLHPNLHLLPVDRVNDQLPLPHYLHLEHPTLPMPTQRHFMRPISGLSTMLYTLVLVVSCVP